MIDIGSFALLSGWFRSLHRVGTTEHDLRYTVSEPLIDLAQGLPTSTVLRAVMQKGGHGLLFVTTILEHQRCHGHEVAQGR